MANIKYGDLSGKRFGMLQVLEPAEPRTFPSGQVAKQWRCRCDCGKEVTVLQSSLVSGHSKSCGCQQTTLGRRWAKDLTGQRFGDLEVLERAGSSSRKAPLWRCLCHRCGQETILEGYRLTDPRSPRKDCLCRTRERAADLSGQTFGALEVLRCKGSYPSGDKAYLCRCTICGLEKIFPSSAIRSGQKSCGCRQYATERMAKMSALGVSAVVEDGCNIYTATRKEPNENNTTGYRWVRCLHRRSGDFIFATFYVKGKRYYRGGFSSLLSAHDWAEKEHDRILNALGISDPREKQKKEDSNEENH